MVILSEFDKNNFYLPQNGIGTIYYQRLFELSLCIKMMKRRI